MKVTFLGVGSAFSRRNPNSNILIESGAIKLLVDCGRTGPAALDQYGLTLKDITHVFITHLHADHIGGMEEVAFMTRLMYKQPVKLLSSPSLLERLWQGTLRGGLEYIELTPGSEIPQTLQDYFLVQPLPPRKWVTIEQDSGLRLYLHPTYHVKGLESYGLEVEELPGGRARRFFFSGDTKYAPDMIQSAAQMCAYVFHDCQLFDSGEHNVFGVHASYNQLRQLPADVRRQMWLYHYGDTRPLPDAVQEGFAGFIVSLQSFTL